MKTYVTVFFCVFLIIMFSSCGQSAAEGRIVNALLLKDSNPPVLESVETLDSDRVRVVFNEPVEPVKGSFSSSVSAVSDGYGIVIKLYKALKPGEQTGLSGTVADKSGNTASFSVKVWGLNTEPARLIINEFTTKGRDKQPDRTELLVTGGGSTAGMVLFDGVPLDYRAEAVLPDIKVRAGDFVTVWWTEVLPDSIYANPAGGVYNVCAVSSSTPSENNGIQVLAESPSLTADVMDCVVYCSFTSSQYGGYGTKEVQARVQMALENGWWLGDGIDSSRSTATRSMSRRPEAGDSNTAGDWYTTVTSGVTFGSANTSAEFQ